MNKILFVALALGATWIISDGLHQNIEHYVQEKEANKDKPLTKEEEFAKKILELRSNKRKQNR